jgi:hypothetical protein
LKNKIRITGAIIIGVFWLALAAFSWFLPSKEMSESERRKLAQFPDLTVEAVLNGHFATNFETYTLDQFPMRDTFRNIKSIFHYYVLNQQDNNDIYVHDGYAAKMEYPLNNDSIDYAIKKFNSIYNMYMKGKDVNVYFSVIPDKGYYLANKSGHLVMDYESMFGAFKNIQWAQYIDITELLTVESYYYTDTHWRQEKILPVAQKLCEAMEAPILEVDKFATELVEKPFYGVYYGQAALPMRPESMHVLKNNYITNATVFDYESNKKIGVYDVDAINDKDLYDTYLHGAKALLRIDNPNSKTNKELIVFRDSFGSSIIPLMIENYKTITVIDIRYVSSQFIKNYVRFNNQDVLFLYSTLVLNNSFTLK